MSRPMPRRGATAGAAVAGQQYRRFDMNAFRAGSVAALAAIALGGCAANPAGGPRQVGNCDGQPGSTATVTIDLTQPGRFNVSPKECRVKGRKPIRWTTTADPPATFVVKFTGATPDPRGRTSFTGTRSPDRPPLAYTAIIPNAVGYNPDGNNAYPYVVTVNGVEIDPSIIIDQ
jgi:hypothetical protein